MKLLFVCSIYSFGLLPWRTAQEAPASTVQRMHQEALPTASKQLEERVWREAKDNVGLVLGIDDFAIKKGHA